MESHLTAKFRHLLKQLPADVRRESKKSYLLWKADPFHTSLYFKQVNEKKRLWSVRVSLGWRALGVRKENNVIIWVWIGPHSEYDDAIKPQNVKRMQTP